MSQCLIWNILITTSIACNTLFLDCPFLAVLRVPDNQLSRPHSQIRNRLLTLLCLLILSYLVLSYMLKGPGFCTRLLSALLWFHPIVEQPPLALLPGLVRDRLDRPPTWTPKPVLKSSTQVESHGIVVFFNVLVQMNLQPCSDT